MLDLFAQGPITDGTRHSPGNDLGCREPDIGRRRKFCHSPIDGIWRRDAVMPQQQRQRLPIDLCLEARTSLERLQFRGKHQYVPDPSIIKRFLAESVPKQNQGPCLSIPEGAGKHPVQPRQRRRASPPASTPLHATVDAGVGTGIGALLFILVAAVGRTVGGRWMTLSGSLTAVLMLCRRSMAHPTAHLRASRAS